MPENTTTTMNSTPSLPKRPTRTIAFLNQKGGVGKTTTVVNLAAAIALAGRTVGVIDLDPQAHLSLHLGVEPDPDRPTIYDVLLDGEVPAADAFCQARPNLFVLPSEVDLAAAETELAGASDRHHRLQKKIRACPLAQQFDFLLIDCPPSLGLLTLNALTLAREVFVPMQAHFLALQGLSRLLETVGMVSQQVNPTLQVAGIILCMFEGNTRLAGEVVDDLTEFFQSQRELEVPWRRCRVLRPAIRRNIKLAESPSFGQSIFDYEPNCPGAQDYQLLASNLLTEWDAFLAARDKSASSTSAPPSSTESQDHDQPADAVIDNEMINALTNRDMNAETPTQSQVEPEIVVRKTNIEDETVNQTETAAAS